MAATAEHAERIDHQQEAAIIAGVARDPGDGGTVVLSGRCGDCGYLLADEAGKPALGHLVTCG